MQPQMKSNTKSRLGGVNTCRPRSIRCMEYFGENLIPDLESYVEELCSPHDSSILLGMVYGAFCI